MIKNKFTGILECSREAAIRHSDQMNWRYHYAASRIEDRGSTRICRHVRKMEGTRVASCSGTFRSRNIWSKGFTCNYILKQYVYLNSGAYRLHRLKGMRSYESPY